MKKLFVIAGFLFATSSLFAQYYEVTPTIGYTFSGKVDNGYGTYDLSNALLYGGKLDVQITDQSYVELGVRRNDATITYSKAGSQESSDFSSGTAHYMVGFYTNLRMEK